MTWVTLTHGFRRLSTIQASGRFPVPVSHVLNLTVHRAFLPGPGSRFLYHSHSGFTPVAQASYPHYPVPPRIHLLGPGFVFNTYSQPDLATGYPGNTNLRI